MPHEYVILVDESDNETGKMEKMRAHKDGGMLHRAFSIFVFNDKGQMLIHKRAGSKYHSGGLWTNTCCSHPRPGESIGEAAHRKLKQEMGFDTELKEVFSFVYRVSFENGLTEHELDHVLTGTFNGKPKPNPEEAEDFKWIAPGELENDVRRNPGKYTPWFRIALEKVITWHGKNK